MTEVVQQVQQVQQGVSVQVHQTIETYPPISIP